MNAWINIQWFMFARGAVEAGDTDEASTAISLDTSLASFSNDGTTLTFCSGGQLLDCAGEDILDESGNLIYADFVERRSTSTSTSVATVASIASQFESDAAFDISTIYGSRPRTKSLLDYGIIRDESGNAILDELTAAIVPEEYYA